MRNTTSNNDGGVYKKYEHPASRWNTLLLRSCEISVVELGELLVSRDFCTRSIMLGMLCFAEFVLWVF